MRGTGSKLLDYVLISGLDDWVYAAEVYGVVRRTGLRHPTQLREFSVGLIAEVLTRGWMVAGEYDGHGFSPWEGGVKFALGRICEDWFARRDPEVTAGEVVWMDLTAAGEALAKEALGGTWAVPSALPVEGRVDLVETLMLQAKDRGSFGVAEARQVALESGLTDPRYVQLLSVGLVAEALTRRIIVPHPCGELTSHQPECNLDVALANASSCLLGLSDEKQLDEVKWMPR